MTVRSNRIFFMVCLLSLIGLLLTGCSCEHEWQRSTCQAPRTCIKCGETEGKIRAHEGGNTACHTPEGCIICGILRHLRIQLLRLSA